ncbi:MAG: DNA polymerase IV [Coriobacteriia bacterium]|nr:DNA polymerase IV [Coriobacteriia bacterium]MCL2537477.1 DNA polymerase IV [Coriobacteriia bacterium]
MYPRPLFQNKALQDQLTEPAAQHECKVNHPALPSFQQRIILHVDLNCFYAQAECFRRPELRDKPVVVGGDEEARHGIVLAKNMIAKGFGIKTGEALWQARQKCPGLVSVRADYRHYQRIAQAARAIYYDYSDRVEPFGLDECWIDVTGSAELFGGGQRAGRFIAEEISERSKSELGMSVSVGVSWNKVFAKFGSDYKKPDGITHITPDNYQDLVWAAPASELLYIGPATTRKLADAGIFSIGDVAGASAKLMRGKLGKIGAMLQVFARGEDASLVRVMDQDKRDVSYGIKSIGNSMTAPHDLRGEADVKALVYLLSESVAQRLRESRLKAQTITAYIRHADLHSYHRQKQLLLPSFLTGEIAAAAYDIVCENEDLSRETSFRSLGVRASNLISMWDPTQTNLFVAEPARIAYEDLEFSIDDLRRRYGNKVVMRGCELHSSRMSRKDIKADNTIHPVGFLRS